MLFLFSIESRTTGTETKQLDHHHHHYPIYQSKAEKKMNYHLDFEQD